MGQLSLEGVIGSSVEWRDLSDIGDPARRLKQGSSGIPATRTGGVEVDIGDLPDGAGSHIGGLKNESSPDTSFQGEIKRLNIAAIERLRNRGGTNRGRQSDDALAHIRPDNGRDPFPQGSGRLEG